MSSTSRTNGALFTMVSARSASISVNPAPSAPGIALHRERSDLGQQVLQTQPRRRQPGQRRQTLRQVVILGLEMRSRWLLHLLALVRQLFNHPGRSISVASESFHHPQACTLPAPMNRKPEGSTTQNLTPVDTRRSIPSRTHEVALSLHGSVDPIAGAVAAW